MPFGNIWLSSMYDILDVTNINKIFILDTGLTLEDKQQIISKAGKVEFILSDINIKGSSDANIKNSLWLPHVLRKTVYLHMLMCELPEREFPLIMMDSDTMFLKGFEELLDESYDMQVCLRSYKDNPNWIAAFFVAYSKQKSQKFLEKWIQEIKNLMISRPDRKWFESHSLNLLLNKIIDNGEYKIGNLPTRLICCERPENFTDETRVIHFKGTHEKGNIIKRLQRFPLEDIERKIKRYSPLGSWSC
jgi:hypothetical protein